VDTKASAVLTALFVDRGHMCCHCESKDHLEKGTKPWPQERSTQGLGHLVHVAYSLGSDDLVKSLVWLQFISGTWNHYCLPESHIYFASNS
jgi:hypothetical protein